MDAPPPKPRPQRRGRPTTPTRNGGDVILGMLAQGIPLTLLPDLVWPTELEHDYADEAGRPDGPRPVGPGRTDFSGGPVAC